MKGQKYVVGPKNVQPRFFNLLANIIDSFDFSLCGKYVFHWLLHNAKKKGVG